MPRIVGVDVPGNKRSDVALTYIYGIGLSTARTILESAGVEAATKADSLNEDELSRISSYIDQHVPTEGRLRRQVNLNVRRLMDIGSYRGLRHRRGLPVRGQRTKTNARTRKGPRRTVARKKGVKEVSRG